MYKIYETIPIHVESEILILAIVAIALTLTIIGITTRVRLLNLISIPFWIFLAYDFLDYPVLVIAFVLMLLFELYWAFFSEL
jgi:hypothetical protein